MKFTRESGEVACGCRSVDECFHGIFVDPEIRALEKMVDAFARKMKGKLRRKYLEGYHGWDDPSWTREKILKALKAHLEKGDPVDIANFAAFMWNRGDEDEATEQSDHSLPA